MNYTKRSFPGTYIRVNKNDITEEKFNNLKLLYPKAMIILEREDIKNKTFLYSFKEVPYRKKDFERLYLKKSSIYDYWKQLKFNIDFSFNATYYSNKILHIPENRNNIFFEFKINLDENKTVSNFITWEEIPTNLLGEAK
ncbi:MAG: hypothetical protein ACRDDY_14240 [Clostridium sp.]|uniref:hypothetical protein n=1 Tax=Clostridium sp. TaxID=1506 RepID=UPI003EE5C07D